MTQVMEPRPTETSGEADDLVAAIHRVLKASPEPLTLSKLRSQLPSQLRNLPMEDGLRRQVAANVLYQYPKYRSQQDRFWDRPMPVHVANLLRDTLQGGPLGWPELRRKLPAYAQGQAESVLQEQVAQGALYRHPRLGGRGGELLGLQPPDPKDYLRSELQIVFSRLGQLQFTQSQLREAALELLHEEEWSTATLPAPPARRARKERPAEGTPASSGTEAPNAPAPTAIQAPAVEPGRLPFEMPGSAQP